MTRVVFYGDQDVLTSYVAAEKLLCDRQLHATWVSLAKFSAEGAGRRQDPPAALLRAICQLAPDSTVVESAVRRLHVTGWSDAATADSNVFLSSELWIAGDDLPDIDDVAAHRAGIVDAVNSVLAAQQAGSGADAVGPLRVILTTTVAAVGEETALNPELLQAQFVDAEVSFRVIRAPIVVEDEIDTTSGWLGLFLAALHDLKNELKERHPEFFGYRGLRCLAPLDYSIPLTKATVAAHAAVEISENPALADACISLNVREPMSVATLVEGIGSAINISLIAVPIGSPLAPIDSLLHEQLQTIGRPPWEWPKSDCVSIDVEHVELVRLMEALKAAGMRLDDARAAANEAAAELFRCPTREINCGGSLPIRYHAFGNGETPIVIINAISQGLAYWERLVMRLSQQRRVLICIHDSQRRKKTLSPSEQLRMISDVCQHEGVQQCHLIGWCTGPKMAIRYCATFPSQVASLVLLNGSYKTTNSPADLDSSYECALKSLCELVDRKPEMAGLVRNQIRRSMEDVQVDFSAAGEAAQVDFDLLTAVNVNLRDAILAPFESDASFIDYARQMIDFWQYDPRDDAVAVEPPVLLLASEHDKVATAAMSREAADFLSRSRLVEARGATHYCLYDRAPWLASVLDDFFNEVESDWRQLNRKQAGLTAIL